MVDADDVGGTQFWLKKSVFEDGVAKHWRWLNKMMTIVIVEYMCG